MSQKNSVPSFIYICFIVKASRETFAKDCYKNCILSESYEKKNKNEIQAFGIITFFVHILCTHSQSFKNSAKERSMHLN